VVKILGVIYFPLLNIISREFREYKDGYDLQSMQSAAGEVACNKTALKRCTTTEIL